VVNASEGMAADEGVLAGAGVGLIEWGRIVLVDFMIIGAQKCGTTSLAEQLARHPQICFCRTKEPGFFNQTTDWQRQLADYHRLYTPMDGQLCGEASTMYTFFPEHRQTHERLHAYNPQLKLIYIMRQPVERIISNYAHEVVRRTVKAGPEAVVFQDPGYVNRSRYGLQLRPYLELFPREQLLPLIFEEYIANQVQALAQIADFLGIAVNSFVAAGEVHAHKSVGESQLKSETLRSVVRTEGFQAVRNLIPPAIRQPIRRVFSTTIEEKPHFSAQLRRDLWRLVEDDVCFVEELLGRRLERWRQGYDS
jgi:hypothetical protein